MRVSGDEPTLFVPHPGGTSIGQRASTGLPPDLLHRAAARLEVLAWLYAFTFFMSAFAPPLLFAEGRRMLMEHTVHVAPGAAAIAMAIAVALAVRVAQPRPTVVTALGLGFEVVSSYGIAAAEFLVPSGLDVGRTWVGLSWVAVWVLLFNVVVPTRPRYAVAAALLAVSAVPVMVMTSVRLFPPTTGPAGALPMFLAFGFPYVLVVLTAYVGARVVYSLGTEVKRARELGSYRLEERLGTGGMGEVWRASHRLLARPAAIKLIRSLAPGHAAGVSEDRRRRFEREAQVIARLRSPHTVTLFDFGVAEDGAFYYVMELLDGMDADRLIKRYGPMPAERVVYVLRQICHSLSEAESCGLVHRDIKPANIFLCRYGEDDDFVKVLDFGIAKIVHQTTPDGETALTVPNVIQGTPAFIAPEQALGGMEVDIRADIYSLGCVAYWLLTGALVFTGDTPMKLLMAHAREQPQPPSSQAELPIPPEMDALVMACLAKGPDERPASPRDLLRHLEAIPLPEPWTAARARQWWQTHVPQSG